MKNLRKKFHIFCWKSHSGGQEDQILTESLFTELRKVSSGKERKEGRREKKSDSHAVL